MIGGRIGGINVFGGGFALYASDGTLIGGLGVSGDASCADHNIGWKVRDRLGLDFVPAGVSATGDDNIIYDLDANDHSPSGFGHPSASPPRRRSALLCQARTRSDTNRGVVNQRDRGAGEVPAPPRRGARVEGARAADSRARSSEATRG